MAGRNIENTRPALAWWRTRFFATLFLVTTLAVLCGCAGVGRHAQDQGVLDLPEVVEASGVAHDEALGIHLIRSITVLRGGTMTLHERFVEIGTLSRPPWVVTFLAPESIQREIRHWLDVSDASLSDALDRTAKVLDAAFPSSVGRSFEVYLVPAGVNYEHRWTSIALRERDVRLRFAVHLPKTVAIDDRGWNAGLFAFLSHEYSHSYFWFHPQWLRNSYSGEVIAYSIQRCVRATIAGPQADIPQHPLARVYEETGSMDPAAIFAKYHAEYPDTWVANVAAEGLFRRAMSGAGTATATSGLPDLCRTIVDGGTDFTWAHRDR